MLSAASSTLTDCIRHVVAGEPVPDLGSLDERSWRHLLAEGQSERLVGLIAGLVADADAGLGPERVAELAEREAEWTIHTLRAEQLAVDAAAALAATGIDHRVLKGPFSLISTGPGPSFARSSMPTCSCARAISIGLLHWWRTWAALAFGRSCARASTVGSASQ